jgi:hypothetical protein
MPSEALTLMERFEVIIFVIRFLYLIMAVFWQWGLPIMMEMEINLDMSMSTPGTVQFTLNEEMTLMEGFG